MQHISGRLAQQKTEGAAIGASSAVACVVEKFDIAVVIHLEFQALYDIVDFGGDERVRFVEFKLVSQFKQCDAFFECPGSAGVLAVNSDHIFSFAGKNSQKSRIIILSVQ